MKFATYDCEVYANWWLLLARDIETGELFRWERFNDVEIGRNRGQLNKFFQDYRGVGFNNHGFDDPLIAAYMQQADNAKLKAMCDFIITGDNLARYKVSEHHGFEPLGARTIDVMPVLKGRASLKTYSARLGYPNIQELPVDPATVITAEQSTDLYTYCINDLQCTERLFRYSLGLLNLRKKLSGRYHLDLVSSSDPQIAEAVMRKLLEDKEVSCHRDVVRPSAEGYRYIAPDYLHTFHNEAMQERLEVVKSVRFQLGEGGGITIPPELRPQIEMGGNLFKMGVGGLHSNEKRRRVIPKGTERLFDLDVVSYYPFMWLKNRFGPDHLMPHLVNVYQDVVDQRLASKAAGDKDNADALKIVINSLFGKTGSKYSRFYDPQTFLQIVMTGQLSLLLLADTIIERTKCTVLSGNTDGIQVLTPNNDELDVLREICREWEDASQLQLEEVEFNGIWAQDVSNYLAQYAPDIDGNPGGWKRKGIYAAKAIDKNPSYDVCNMALIDHIENGTPFATFIKTHRNILDFTTLQKVYGGATWRGEKQGGTVRWYMGIDGTQITRSSNGYNIGNSEQAIIANKLPKRIPVNLDHDWYIKRCHALWHSLGGTGR